MKKSPIGLIILAVIFAVAAVFVLNKSKPHTPQLVGKSILPAFSLADVARIEIGAKLTLSASDKGWVVDSMYGYPADRDKIAENLLKLQDLKVGQVARSRRIENPLVVQLKDAAGQELANLALGEAHVKKGMNQAAMMYGGSFADGRYLTFEGEAVLVNDALEAFDGDVKKWCSTRIANISAADVEAVAFSHAGEAIELTKGTNDVWTLKGLAPTEELDTSKTYSLDSVLSYLDFATVVDPNTSEAELGFATGYVYTVTLKGGTNHVATVGNIVKGTGTRYFKLDGSKWIYTISSYAASNMMKTRKDLVKAKETKDEKKDATK